MKKTKFLITPASTGKAMACFEYMKKEDIALPPDHEKVSRGFSACYGRYDGQSKFCVSHCKFRSGCAIGAPEGTKMPIPSPTHCKGFKKMKLAYLKQRLEVAHLAGNERQVWEIEAEISAMPD